MKFSVYDYDTDRIVSFSLDDMRKKYSLTKEELKKYNEWNEILLLSESNESLKILLKKLFTTYYMVKDNGRKT